MHHAFNALTVSLLLAYGAIITLALALGLFVQRNAAEWTDTLRGLGLP